MYEILPTQFGLPSSTWPRHTWASCLGCWHKAEACLACAGSSLPRLTHVRLSSSACPETCRHPSGSSAGRLSDRKDFGALGGGSGRGVEGGKVGNGCGGADPSPALLTPRPALTASISSCPSALALCPGDWQQCYFYNCFIK